MRERPRSLFICLTLLAGCDLHACGAPPVAVVKKIGGAVVLATAAAPERWSAATLGAELDMGDAIRTGHRSTARLALDDGSTIDLEPNSTLRLLLEAPGDASPALDVVAGAVVVSADDAAEIATPGASASLAAGSRLELRRTAERLELTLTVGRARLSETGGNERELTLGEPVAIVGAAQGPVAAPLGARPPASEATPAAIETGSGVLVTRPADVESAEAGGATAGDALDHADFAVAAGSDFLVRDALPPTAIAITFGDDCAEGALVERLAGRRGARVAVSGRGAASVSLPFPPGSHRYRVRCLVEGRPARRAVARGRVRVLRSSGQAALPRSAPESRVDADGRTYSILYQNLLPSITVRWPGGVSGPGTLVVRSRGATRRVAVHGPEHRFDAGSLDDGVYFLHFEAASGRRRSRETTVRIRFDESAASATLAEPGTGSFGPGETVSVSGSVLTGWHVVAGGREIPVGRDQRFEGRAVVPATGALVVKFSKPGRRAHYYVRRARASAEGE